MTIYLSRFTDIHFVREIGRSISKIHGPVLLGYDCVRMSFTLYFNEEVWL